MPAQSSFLKYLCLCVLLTDFSDYKEHKLDDTNIGFRMLRSAGWSEGEGLGEQKEGIVNPINKYVLFFCCRLYCGYTKIIL